MEDLDHVLDVRDDEWALEHPQRCRDAGSLLDCATHQRVIEDARIYALPEPGRYRVRAHKLHLESEPVALSNPTATTEGGNNE